jgi:hypothetical protein
MVSPHPLPEWERRDPVENRREPLSGGAIVIASQCPLCDWHLAIGDSTTANAICNQLLYNAYKLKMRGKSVRLKSLVSGKNERERSIAQIIE